MERRRKSRRAIEEGLSWYHDGHDREENAETTPPANERIETACIWVVEFYTPSQAESLSRSLSALGWSLPDRNDPEGVLDWLVSQSGSMSSVGWKNLGIVARPGEQRFLGMFRTAPLPDGVDIAHGVIDHVFPGVFAICMQFVLADEAAGAVEKVLREDRRTFAKHIPRGVQFVTPFDQKQEDASRVRAELRTRCVRWFVENLPGYFSTFDASRFPTAEFLFLQEAEPFGDGSSWMSFLELLGLGRQFMHWESKSLRGVRIAEARSLDNVLIMAARERDFRAGRTEDQWRRSGGAERYSYASHLERLHRSLTVWGLAVLASSLERRLSASRNDVASVNLRRTGQASRQLRDRQAALLTLSRDLLPICAGMKRFGKNILDSPADSG